MRLFIFFSFMLLADNILAQEFNVSAQKGVDLRKYETFTILRGEVVTDENRKINKEDFYNEFKKVVRRELEEKGYKHTDDTTAQLLVSYVVETSRVLETENLGPLGQMPQSNPGVEQTQTWSREFNRGTLIIEIEAGKGNSVWSVEGTMDVGRAQGVSILEYSIKNAFSEFPNKKRKRNKKG